MGLDNGAKTRARRKHREKCQSVKGNTMREKLERLWADALVRAPHHVAGHLTEAEAVARNKGYYKNGKPHAVATLVDGDNLKVARGVSVELHPVTGKLQRAAVKVVPPPPSEE